jgi:hypothetical protein
MEYLMDLANMNYFRPGYPFILVKELTKDIIVETIQAYAEQAKDIKQSEYIYGKEFVKELK